jgi:SAM-dependent methyltransferase
MLAVIGESPMAPRPEEPVIYSTPDGRLKLRSDMSSRLHQTPLIFNSEAAVILQYYRGGVHLDIGCGARKITASAIGVDLSTGAVPYVSASVNVLSPAHDLRVFSNDSVDFISAMHSFEHYDNPVEVLSEWHRVLKTGGRIGMIVPSRDGLIPDKEAFHGEHKFDYDASAFRKLASEFQGRFQILALDTLQNGWSINCILEKIESRPKFA